jgi:hypothetical protein
MRALLGIGLLAITATGLAAEPAPLKLYHVDGKFEDVKQDVELVVEARGFKAERPLLIGEMLTRTGKDLGATKQIFGHAEAIQFCPASLSRRTMEADPANIVHCPYTIFVYTLPAEKNKVYVGYRRIAPSGSIASQAVLKEVDALLDGMVREALNLK